jgi:hypothetical protein
VGAPETGSSSQEYREPEKRVTGDGAEQCDGPVSLGGEHAEVRGQLYARHPFTLPGVLDAVALFPAATFRGLLILSAPSEFSRDAGFLHLLFEQTQGIIYVVVFDLNG